MVALALSSCVAPMTQRGDVEQAEVEREVALQKEIYVKSYMENLVRLKDVAFPILVGNADLCDEKVGSYFGMLINSPHSLGQGYNETFKSLYGYSDDARITGILKNGPAGLADVKVGDVVKSVAGKPFYDTTSEGVAGMTETMQEIIPGSSTVFMLERKGEPLEVEITPVKACDYPVSVLMDDALNAFADGEAIYVTSGMMRFANSDNELAFVVGHELAHNMMSHVDAKETNFWLGTIFDLIAAGYGLDTQHLFGRLGAEAYSQEFENEADYVGLYYIERGGYDISEAPTFWRRMAAENPDSIKDNYSSTHPSSSERFVRMENTIEEIRAKQQSSQLLVPSMKSK